MDKFEIHINDYVTRLLSDKQFCDREYQIYRDNCYIICNVDGNIAPAILNLAIRRAKWNRKIRSMLSDILNYVDEKSISDENFRLLLRFRGRRRNTFLSNIGHADLAFYQLQIINRYPAGFEAFAKLFDQICQYDIFKDDDMLQILKDSSDVTSFGIQTCIALACEKYGPSSKIDVASIWANAMEANGK